MRNWIIGAIIFIAGMMTTALLCGGIYVFAPVAGAAIPNGINFNFPTLWASDGKVATADSSPINLVTKVDGQKHSGGKDGSNAPNPQNGDEVTPMPDMTSTDNNGMMFYIDGVPANVNKDEVDWANHAPFHSPWEYLSNLLAEPGKLVVDSEFPQELIDGAGGAIWRSNGLNTYPLINTTWQNVGCPEGGQVYISVQEALVEGDTFVLAFRAPDGSNVHLYVRCLPADGLQGSDAGNNLKFSHYRPGYGAVTVFSPNPGGGFVSSDGAQDALDISCSTVSSGSEGANNTYVITIDARDGSYTLAKWDCVSMSLITTNWWHE